MRLSTLGLHCLIGLASAGLLVSSTLTSLATHSETNSSRTSQKGRADNGPCSFMGMVVQRNGCN